MKRSPLSISQILSSACGDLNPHLKEYAEGFKGVSRYGNLKSKGGKEKLWLLEKLTEWCIDRGYELKTELKFHPARKFKFDYAISELKIAIEYEGLISKKSRHTTITGYSKDTDKYNLAATLGWRVLRVTALNYQTIINTLNEMK